MVASAPVTLSLSDMPTTLVSLGVGLVGVWLARTVFVDRENRRLQQRQTLRQTAPVTGIAMLLAGVVISDRHFGISSSAFLGLGIGWTTVLLLDIIGERVVKVLRTMLGAEALPVKLRPADNSGMDGEMTTANRDLPADMAEQLRRIDDVSPDP